MPASGGRGNAQSPRPSNSATKLQSAKPAQAANRCCAVLPATRKLAGAERGSCCSPRR